MAELTAKALGFLSCRSFALSSPFLAALLRFPAFRPLLDLLCGLFVPIFVDAVINVERSKKGDVARSIRKPLTLEFSDFEN